MPILEVLLHILPSPFVQMLSYLETNSLDEEGLLRVPGSSVRINSLQQELEANFYNSEGCPFEGVKSTDVCSLLKLFIRYTHSLMHTHTHTHTGTLTHTCRVELLQGSVTRSRKSPDVENKECDVHTRAHSL